MKKGTISIVFGWLLVAMQIMALMGSNLDSGFARMGALGLVGYFLPGFLGIVLLCRGYKKRRKWQGKKSNAKPDTIDAIMGKIQAGLTGDPIKDRTFLNRQIQLYRSHPLADNIIGACAELMAKTLSDDELDQWEQAMKADDAQRNGYDIQEEQTAQAENDDSSGTATAEWETTESVNEDGSKVITHINNRTNEGIIQELDSQGNLIRETFGRFEEVKKISDEEIEDWICELARRQEKEKTEEVELLAKEIRDATLLISADMARLADRIDLETVLAGETFEEYELELAQKLADGIEDICITLCRNANELEKVVHILEQALELPQEKVWDSRANKSQNPIKSMNELFECHCEFQDRVKTALNKMDLFIIESKNAVFGRDYLPALKECREKIDKVNAYNGRSVERIRENIALMEQKNRRTGQKQFRPITEHTCRNRVWKYYCQACVIIRKTAAIRLFLTELCWE